MQNAIMKGGAGARLTFSMMSAAFAVQLATR